MNQPIQPTAPSASSPSAGPSRVAVLSGGSRGIGRAIALDLAAQGMSIVLLHSPGGAASAEQTLSEIRALNVSAAAFPADVSDEAQVIAAFDKVLKLFGRMDVVVNGAGHLKLGRLVDLDLADLDKLHQTLIRGVFVMCQHAARVLEPGGSIVNLSSVAVGLDVSGSSVYVAGKAAVEAMTRVIAKELAERDISVNAVAVGFTATDGDILAEVARSRPDFGDPVDEAQDIGGLAAYLAGPRGHWMTGHVLAASARPA